MACGSGQEEINLSASALRSYKKILADSARIDIEDQGDGLVRFTLNTAEMAAPSFERLVGTDGGLIHYGGDVREPTF